MAKASKKVMTTIYLNPDQKERLDRLSAKTRVPVSEFIRKGVEEVLKRYNKIIVGNEKTVAITT